MLRMIAQVYIPITVVPKEPTRNKEEETNNKCQECSPNTIFTPARQY